MQSRRDNASCAPTVCQGPLFISSFRLHNKPVGQELSIPVQLLRKLIQGVAWPRTAVKSLSQDLCPSGWLRGAHAVLYTVLQVMERLFTTQVELWFYGLLGGES